MLNDNMTQEQFDSAFSILRKAAASEIDRTLSQYHIDVILGPGDSRLCSFAAAAGYPVASLPLGYADFNGRAFSVHALARAGDEGKMLRVMNAWEATLPDARKPPAILVNWEP
jgi:amidase